DMRGIGLDPNRVTVDLDTADLSELARTVEPPLLLDDIDIADDEFEDWLRNQRTAFEQRIRLSTIVAAPRSSEQDVIARRHLAPVRPWIRVLPPPAIASESGLFLSRLVGDRI